jgi:hypothetical protein
MSDLNARNPLSCVVVYDVDVVAPIWCSISDFNLFVIASLGGHSLVTFPRNNQNEIVVGPAADSRRSSSDAS